MATSASEPSSALAVLVISIITVAIAGAVLMTIWNNILMNKVTFIKAKLSYYEAVIVFILSRLMFSAVS